MRKEDDVNLLQQAIPSLRSIEFPTSHRVNVVYGGYGRYSRFDITQHYYAGGGWPGNGGYVEVLEIKDAPDGRVGNVVHEDNNRQGAHFTEFETIDQANEAFDNYWCSPGTTENFAKLPGFIRTVNCGELTPWFYAIGDQELVGDYAFPEDLQEDPAYSFGRQFLVTERIVYWGDGNSTLLDRGDLSENPRPLAENELLVSNALRQFQGQFKDLLAGKITDFIINFTDGTKFVGKLMNERPKN